MLLSLWLWSLQIILAKITNYFSVHYRRFHNFVKAGFIQLLEIKVVFNNKRFV
jgi:hypothetical protein